MRKQALEMLGHKDLDIMMMHTPMCSVQGERGSWMDEPLMLRVVFTSM